MGGADPILIDDWHAVAELDFLRARGSFGTQLLDVPLEVSCGATPDDFRVRRHDDGALLPSRVEYGHVFTTLGEPARDVVHFPERHEEDRIRVTGGSIGVAVSGLRAIENFLDMGHFPFVHTGYLGVEPQTEVEPYEVVVTEEDEILATACRFFQPLASPSAEGGMMVDYVYKVCRPYTVCLYKSNPVEPERWDVIVLFVQPVSEERCIAHPWLAYLPHDLDEEATRWYMQLIFAQDKPILENELPKRLPLDRRAEIPVRADATSLAFRRWLGAHGVTYGAIPAARDVRDFGSIS